MIGTKYLAWLVAGTTAFLGPSTSRTCPPGSPAGSAEGDVVVIAASTDDGAGTDYLAFLDVANETGFTNGQADRVFRLQTTEKKPGQFSSRRLVDASVEWRRGAVEIKTASEEMTLALEEQAGAPNSQDILGYGLSNMRWRVDIPERPTLEWYSTLGVSSTSSSDSCDSGGEWADKCEVDCGDRGCSVGCSNGATACCNCGWTGPKCYCKAPA